MNADKLKHFREQLINLRTRVGGEVNSVAQALQEEVNVNANLSSAPVHLADVASGMVDADVEVLHTERGILEQINDALGRLDHGTYGVCENCGTPINEERLKALPYAATCVRCARTESAAAGVV
jgi:RNA polymerase-binding protein DksA